MGKIFRLIAHSLDCTVHTEGHVQALLGLALPSDSNDIFATIDNEGFVLVWDLNDMVVITRCIPVSMNRIQGSSVFIDHDRKEYVGG